MKMELCFLSVVLGLSACGVVYADGVKAVESQKMLEFKKTTTASVEVLKVTDDAGKKTYHAGDLLVRSDSRTQYRFVSPEAMNAARKAHVVFTEKPILVAVPMDKEGTFVYRAAVAKGDYDNNSSLATKRGAVLKTAPVSIEPAQVQQMLSNIRPVGVPQPTAAEQAQENTIIELVMDSGKEEFGPIDTYIKSQFNS